MTKKVLFVSIDGMTDQLGQSQVLPYLTGLSKAGFVIEICSCEKSGNFEKNNKVVTEILKESNIQWNYCFYDSKVPVISQRNNFRKLSRLVQERVAENKNNVILHCRSYLPALIGFTLKEKQKIPFIFDMRGFWADERIDGNIWKMKNPIHRNLYSYFKRKEKEMLRYADHIVTLTANAQKEIESWKIESMKGITVIPCCADLEHFNLQSEETVQNCKKNLGIPVESFVIGYLGALGTWYMLEEMLDFCAVATQSNKNTLLFFVTNDNAEDVYALAAKKGIPADKVRVKAAKRDEVPVFISCFDIGLFFIKPLYSKKGSSPTKLAELLGCGIPVVTNKGVGDVDSIMQNSQAGICVNDFTSLEYSNAIAQFPELLKQNKSIYRNTAQSMFSLQYGIEKYKVIYSQLIKN